MASLRGQRVNSLPFAGDELYPAFPSVPDYPHVYGAGNFAQDHTAFYNALVFHCLSPPQNVHGFNSSGEFTLPILQAIAANKLIFVTPSGPVFALEPEGQLAAAATPNNLKGVFLVTRETAHWAILNNWDI